MQPTRCQDSLPGGVVGVGVGGISAQLDPIAPQAIIVVHRSASDWVRDHPGDSNSDRSDNGLSLRTVGARRSAPCDVSTRDGDLWLGNE